jgi:DNA-binding MarR family transcriptional regulator
VAGRDDAIERIMAARQRLTQVFAFDRCDPLLAANLTMPQLKVLLLLALRDGAAGHDLTDALGVSLATMTGIVDRLVGHGLVSRREDPRDRRVRRVELTAPGRELMDRILSAGAEHQRRLLQRLDAEGLATVQRAIELMLDAATAED